MKTFRNKYYIICDEEVFANDEEHSKEVGKKQIEEKLYKTDINFVKIEHKKAVDADMASKIKRI